MEYRVRGKSLLKPVSWCGTFVFSKSVTKLFLRIEKSYRMEILPVQELITDTFPHDESSIFCGPRAGKSVFFHPKHAIYLDGLRFPFDTHGIEFLYIKILLYVPISIL